MRVALAFANINLANPLFQSFQLNDTGLNLVEQEDSQRNMARLTVVCGQNLGVCPEQNETGCPILARV